MKKILNQSVPFSKSAHFAIRKSAIRFNYMFM